MTKWSANKGDACCCRNDKCWKRTTENQRWDCALLGAVKEDKESSSST